jgi:DNA-directed RNA polymerase specialized sigma24 family protein
MADEIENDEEESEGFSHEEIAAQIAPWLAEVDRDYDRALEILAKVFEAKGPEGSEIERSGT